MSRKAAGRPAARPALLGDREHTRRVGARTSLAVFAGTLLVLSPLAYGLALARSARPDRLGVTDLILVAVIVIAAAAAAGFATNVAVHLLGREARARRRG